MAKAKMPVIIRPLGALDKGAGRSLWTAYLEFYGTTVPQDVDAADTVGAARAAWLTQDDNATARTPCDRVGQATHFMNCHRVTA